MQKLHDCIGCDQALDTLTQKVQPISHELMAE